MTGLRRAATLGMLTLFLLTGCTGSDRTAAVPSSESVPSSPAAVSSQQPSAAGLPVCRTDERPYPTSVPLYPTRASYLYFSATAAGSDARIDVPGLRLAWTEDMFETQTPVLLHAEGFTDADAGAHPAALTTPARGVNCRFSFFLKRGTRLSLQQSSGTVVRLSGRLTRSTLGPDARMLGYAGRAVSIHRVRGRRDDVVRRLTTDGAGRFATTVPAGSQRWEATFAGDAESVSEFTFATP